MARNDLPGPSAPNFPQRLREAVMTYLGRTGDPLDRGITLRDLIEGGFARLRDGYTAGQAAASGGALPIAPEVQAEEPDLTPPPTPTGFTVSAAISHVFIEHDAPLYTQGHGHLRTRVYGKIVAQGDPLPVFADAVEITQFTGTVHAHPSNPSTQWRLWIKWESADGVLSATPAGGTNGLQVVTGEDVSAMVAAMTGAGKPFTVLTESTEIGGVIFPAGIYSTLAFIQDLQVTNAKIANLAVDNAKIADLAVDTGQIADLAVTDAKIESLDAEKITAGYLSADRIEAGSLDAKIANIDAAVITSGVIDIARIDDGSITNAKIGNAQIGTLKLAENAVSVAAFFVGNTGALSFLPIEYCSSGYILLPPGFSITVSVRFYTELRFDATYRCWVTGSIHLYKNVIDVDPPTQWTELAKDDIEMLRTQATGSTDTIFKSTLPIVNIRTYTVDNNTTNYLAIRGGIQAAYLAGESNTNISIKYSYGEIFGVFR